jgi:hypothetical protein
MSTKAFKPGSVETYSVIQNQSRLDSPISGNTALQTLAIKMDLL